MKKIHAVISEDCTESVLERLVMIGAGDVLLSETRVPAEDPQRREVYRGSRYRSLFVPRVVVEWWGDDDAAENVGRAILNAVEKVGGSASIYVTAIESTARDESDLDG